MKKFFILFIVMALLPLTTVVAQSLEDYIAEHRGDSLVIKDDYAYGAQNTLYSVINADTLNVPAGRVYVLQTNGYYSQVNNITSSANRKTIIMGENQESVKTSKGAAPPVICGAVREAGNTTGGIGTGYDLLVKNCNLVVGNAAGGMGWAFVNFAGPGMKVQIDNCIIEHTLWTFVGGPPADEVVILTNNYFVNLAGHECRRNGGVTDFNNGTHEDTLIVENNTHVNVQGSIYKFRKGYIVDRSVFNHNTFVNCAGYVFMSSGTHTDISVTNNIFVNCNIQGYSTSLNNKDNGEVDLESLPTGLVNVLDDSAFAANGKTFYVDKNLVYWDPIFSDYIATLNTTSVNGHTDWVSQMIKMNSRSQAMFDDNVTYPKLTEGEWIEKLPNFASTDVLFTDQLDIIKEFVIACVDTEAVGSLVKWRQADNNVDDYFTYSDWPVPIDLSYDDADLLTAGLNGFPLGDLNWFPTQHAAWLAQRDAELSQIDEALYTGTAVEEVAGIPVNYQLSQNYPNPFNPTTVINFSIPKAGQVSLKVYNSLGQEIATLVNEFKGAANYQVDFDASNLSSGVYFYSLKVDNGFQQTKKMLLIK